MTFIRTKADLDHGPIEQWYLSTAHCTSTSKVTAYNRPSVQKPLGRHWR